MVQDYRCRFNIHACIYLELFILFHPEIKYAELLIIQYLTLMDIGYEITDVTFNGIDAIKSAQRNQPDIALLDIILEGQELEGTDVGRKLREISEDIIIIYVTAHPTDKNFENALLSTHSAFIEKP